MDQRLSDQLDKVIAMADSSHDGEAVVAVRKARQLLSKGGLSFGDLARAASSYSPRANRPFAGYSGQQMHLETQLLQLRQRMDELQADIQAQDVQLEFWRLRAGELEQRLQAKLIEVERWRDLTRETVEKLWDLGHPATSDELIQDQAAGDAPLLKTGSGQ